MKSSTKSTHSNKTTTLATKQHQVDPSRAKKSIAPAVSPVSNASTEPAASAQSTDSTTQTANASLAAVVQEFSTFLDKAEPKLGSNPALTGTEKRRTLKPRKGAEKFLAQLAPIVQQHGLDSESLSSQTMLSRLQDAETLQPLQTRLQKVTKQVTDEVFSAHSDAWNMGLQFYAMLRRRAKTDGNVAGSLQPVVKAFQYRHPLIKEQHPTKRQTQAKSKLKKATAHAESQGVLPAPAAGPTPTSAAQAAATNGSVAGPTPPAPSTAPSQAQVASAPVAPASVPAAPPAAPAAAPPAMQAVTTNGTSSSH